MEKVIAILFTFSSVLIATFFVKHFQYVSLSCYYVNVHLLVIKIKPNRYIVKHK